MHNMSAKLPVDQHGSMTAAQLAAIPTGTAPLRGT